MIKISKKQAKQYGREGIKGWNYKLPDTDGGVSVIYGEATSEHGERKTGEKSRIYYILDGKAEFIVNGEKTLVNSKDVIVIPPNSLYNYLPKSPMIKVILFMELLDN